MIYFHATSIWFTFSSNQPMRVVASLKMLIILCRYMSLGDHDQRGNVAAQVAYTNVSNKWQMPAPFFVKHITSKFNQHTLDLIFTDSIGLEVGKFQIEIHITINFSFKSDGYDKAMVI